MTVTVPGSLTYTYLEDGVTTVFSYPVRFLEASELLVIREAADGVRTTMVYNVDYTVSGAGTANGGSITRTAVTDGGKIILTRSTASKQLVDLKDSQRNPAEAVELQLDRLAMVGQDIDERMGSYEAKTDAIDQAVVSTANNAGAAAADRVQTGLDRTAADASATAAAASAAGVNLPSVTANTMLVDNAAGTAREAKTFAEVRTLLEVPNMADLPYLLSSEHGVPGDGTDQTTSVQALYDSLPTEGGTIELVGDVVYSSLDLHGKRNIMTRGQSGNGAGAGQRTMLRTNAGAVGATVSAIDCHGTFNVSWENLYFRNANAAFNGILLNYGAAAPVSGDDSALMSLDDCYFNLAGASTAKGLWLYGATQGSFERTTFAGDGTLIQMQNAAGVGFCNVHNFRSCNIKPTGSAIPVQGSGEGITFQTCNIQASSGDGKGRFWTTSLNQDFRGVNLIGCTFYDVTASGEIWGNFYWGQGLNIQGCVVAGSGVTSSYGFQLGGGGPGGTGVDTGVTGFSVVGNSFRFLAAGLTIGGTIVNQKNARKGFIGGNSCFGGSYTLLIGNLTALEETFFAPNFINGQPDTYGSHMQMWKLPTAAGSMLSGSFWLDTANGNVVKAVP